MTTASLRDGNDIREVLRRERRFGAKLDSYDKYRDGNETHPCIFVCAGVVKRRLLVFLVMASLRRNKGRFITGRPHWNNRRS